MSRKRKNPFSYDPDAFKLGFLQSGGRKKTQRKGNRDWKALVAILKNVAVVLAAVTMVSLFSPKVFANPFKMVQVTDGYGEYTLLTKANDMGEIYQGGSLRLASGDTGVVASHEQVKDGMEVAVDRAITVHIQSQGETKSIRMAKGTVQEALELAAIDFDEQDEFSPALDSVLNNGDTVNHAVIDTSMVTKKASIAFATVEVEDDSLPAGTRKVISEGKSGSKNIKYNIKYRDGVEIERSVSGETILSKPVDRTIAVGTGSSSSGNHSSSGGNSNGNPSSNNTGGLGGGTSGGSAIVVPPIEGLDPSQVKEVKTMSATGYDPESAGTTTATGTTAKRGTVAVYPSEIPLGTRMYIEGYGYGMAEDTGSAIGYGRIDLYFMRHTEAIQWGRRSVQVYILK